MFRADCVCATHLSPYHGMLVVFFPVIVEWDAGMLLGRHCVAIISCRGPIQRESAVLPLKQKIHCVRTQTVDLGQEKVYFVDYGFKIFVASCISAYLCNVKRKQGLCEEMFQRQFIQ